MKYRLLRGIHQDSTGVHIAPAVIESDQDLCALHNRGNSIRFELVDDDAPTDSEALQEAAEEGYSDARPDPADLTKLTNRQLRKLAEDRGIDVSDCTNKEQLVNTLTSEGVEA